MGRGPTLLLCGILALTSAQTASARIGDNIRACELRYGRAVRTSDAGDMATYRKGRLSVVVHFSSGVVDMVSYRKLPMADTPVSHRPAPPFVEDEILTLLTDNAGGLAWVEAGTSEKARLWAMADGSLFAMWDRSSDALTIYTAKFADTAGA